MGGIINGGGRKISENFQYFVKINAHRRYIGSKRAYYDETSSYKYISTFIYVINCKTNSPKVHNLDTQNPKIDKREGALIRHHRVTK